nr:hypothetical protein [Marinicella sp. W31]MDC2877338.1 hypothetical protein [Marinicella sp. W31]
MSTYAGPSPQSSQIRRSTASRRPAREGLDGYRALIASAAPLDHVLADTAGLHLEVTGSDEPEVICSLPVSCPADNR